MSGLDEVLERLVNEPAFRDQLTEDPVRILSGYELDADDIEVLAARVTADAGEAGSVEARQSKSALVGLLTQVFDTGGNLGGHRTPGADPGFNPDPPPPDGGGAGPGVDADVGKYGFNPQPDPPVVDTEVDGFNPQPEPPPVDTEVHGFNPQPEPPAETAAPVVDSELAKVGFNPQPEPPAADAMGIDPTPFDEAEDAMGISPQPFDEAGDAMGISPNPFAEAEHTLGVDPEPFQPEDVVGDEQHR